MTSLVSIVMPCHDVVDFVAEAVTSAARQTWPRLELVAIDDGSTDGTGELLERLAGSWTGPQRRMIVHRQAQSGAAAARNAGLDRASGDLICFLDSDDRLDAQMVERVSNVLADDRDLVLASGLWRYVDAQGHPTGIVSDAPHLRHDARSLVVEGPLHSATGVIVRADAAREAGQFDTGLSGCIDLDWFVRVVAGRGKAAAIVPEPLADYRKRDGQITANWARMEANWTRVLQKMDLMGEGLDADELRRAKARNQIYWATLAYQAGDYAATRRLVAQSWRLDPKAASRDRLARIRTLAALASLLPGPLHETLRRRVASRQ
ncbi:glycosyltransferase family A protein [Palleronia sp. LCG004]|uniref:glycosyltransferase family 2 protein n=1 Tax=Palleronia sp. LCG004 TaxID=3079304 RepID=UPI0029427C40|nr:glycosyltransferase family A protein [Palleronia sp. LCG004]WOI55708.1 glycosyltransferase family A protein [Palleronia sp. LCG004]